MPGRVEAIRIAPEREQLPEPVDSIDVTDEGLPGDRYFGRGDITLVEEEALEAFREDTGIELSHAEIRRQVLTSGVRLNDLLGKRFRVGGVEAVGAEWCEPCAAHRVPHLPGRAQGHGAPGRPPGGHRPARADRSRRRGRRGQRRRRMSRLFPPGGSDQLSKPSDL